MDLQWRSALATGIKWQDDEHRELVRRMSDLLLAMESHHVPEMIEELLLFLHDYVRTHFAHEEDFMEQHQMDSRQVHIQRHEEFVSRLHEIHTTYMRQGPSTYVVMNLQKWLREFLLNHVARTDKSLAAYA